jgi:NADH pyrophosphatase NudC (nudix superfamily)
MAFVKQKSSVPDSVRPYLEGVAKNLADRLWGPNGPPWGTSLSELEDLVVSLRQILSEQMLHVALQRQAAEDTPRSAEFRDCPSCGKPTESREPEPRLVNTRGGEAEWQEPHAYCPRCRRAFFPSVQKLGD